jgi:hypothetical protein
MIFILVVIDISPQVLPAKRNAALCEEKQMLNKSVTERENRAETHQIAKRGPDFFVRRRETTQ